MSSEPIMIKTKNITADKREGDSYQDVNSDCEPTKIKNYSRPLLGQYLVDENLINREQLQVALKEQRICQERLGQILVRFKFIDEESLQKALSSLTKVPWIDLETVEIDPKSVRLLLKDYCLKEQIILFQKENSNYKLAMADPENIFLKDEVIALLKKTTSNAVFLTPFHADGNIIESALHIHFKTTVNEPYIVKDNEECVRLVNSLIQEAARLGASDLHFQPESDYVNLKYRIDGILTHAHVFHKAAWPSINVRLKVMSGLDIAESRRPQNGRFAIKIDSGEIECRVSIHPTVHGENIVIRVLDKSKNPLQLDQLGFEKKYIKSLQDIVSNPQGLIVISGPTGSGKTTTLYALINHMDLLKRNIMTLEEPIEYIFQNIRQTQIFDNKILSYSEGIKSLLRQDPDVLLISEIRDSDTAKMALRAAQTGHLVLATLHTKDSFSVPTRLIDLGVSPSILADNLIASIATRLVRKVCTHCQKKNFLRKSLDKVTARESYCFYCFGTGYSKRVPIVEILKIDDEISSLIAHGASSLDIKRHAVSQNMVTLHDYAKDLVKNKITSSEEIQRVLGKI